MWILWTPLADDDATINGYLTDYANAVREIAAGDNTILFWDANAFMNQNMQNNPALVDNWFDDDMYITPLAALDVARGFFTHVKNNGGVATMILGELNSHNLRQTSDGRKFKGDIIRDNIAAGVSVSGTTISMDLSAMVNAGYAPAWGVLGSLLSTFAVVLPSFALMLFISKFLMKHRSNPSVEHVFSGLRPAVVGLIAAATLLLMNSENFSSMSENSWRFCLSIMLFIFAFVAQKVYRLGAILIILLCGTAGIILGL